MHFAKPHCMKGQFPQTIIGHSLARHSGSENYADPAEFDEEHSRAWKDNLNFSELAGLRIDLNRPAMLLDDDVVANRQAEASPFSGGLRREERIEHLLLYVRRDTGAIVSNPDLDTIAKAFGGGGAPANFFVSVPAAPLFPTRRRHRY